MPAGQAVDKGEMGRPRSVDDAQILEAARRCFLKHGASVSTAVIAREIGVSHTTVFNRFGTKEALMIAALGPGGDVPWVVQLEAGPDGRALVAQLAEIGTAIIAYFRDLMPRVELLASAGLTVTDVFASQDVPGPVVAHRALTAWFSRAIDAGLVETSDPEMLALLTIGTFRAKTFTERVCKMGVGSSDSVEEYVARVCTVLIEGFGTAGDRRGSQRR